MKIIIDHKQAFRMRLFWGILVVLFALPLWAMNHAGIETYHIAIPLVVVMQIYLVQRLKNAQMLLIAVLYFFLYFIYLIPYFYYRIPLSLYPTYQNTAYFSQVLYLFYLFYSGLTFSAAWNVNDKRFKIKDLIKIKPNQATAFLFIIFLSIIIIMVFRQGVNVFGLHNSYEAYKDNLQQVNALPLFAILFLFFVPYLIGSKKLRHIVFFSFAFLLGYYCITRGFRMVLAPLGFVVYFHYFDALIKTKYVIIGVFAGFVLMVWINALKKNKPLEMYELFSENKSFILSHHADNLYGSAAGIGLMDKGIISFDDRVLLNVGFLSEIIVPPLLLPEPMKYPHIISLNTPNGGGGLFVTGAYMMWGNIGVMLFGFLLLYFVRTTYVYQSSIMATLCGVILIFVARWMSYDFHVILRFSFFAMMIYFVLKKLKWYA